MQKYMCSHQIPPGAFTREQICHFAEAAQHHPHVRGYRSFVNLTQGKVFCVLEASDRETIAAWFEEMGIPCDDITMVEFEGDRGVIQDVAAAQSVSSQ